LVARALGELKKDDSTFVPLLLLPLNPSSANAMSEGEKMTRDSKNDLATTINNGNKLQLVK
jgi:hypothetical protein